MREVKKENKRTFPVRASAASDVDSGTFEHFGPEFYPPSAHTQQKKEVWLAHEVENNLKIGDSSARKPCGCGRREVRNGEKQNLVR